MNFEWDDGKAASNLAKHGVRFDYALYVFGVGALSAPGRRGPLAGHRANRKRGLCRHHPRKTDRRRRRRDPDHFGEKGNQP